MNEQTLKKIRRFTTSLARTLVLVGFLVIQLAAQADSIPFSRIVVFGDSLSDIGNFYRLTGGALPPPPYENGRFSNGPLWIEYLADDLGMQLFPSDDYAVAGATTSHLNSNDGVLGLNYPGLQDEIAQFLAGQQAAVADPDALYTIWAGANDFFVALQSGERPGNLIANGVNNTIVAVQQLWDAGARHLLVVNAPDLGITPFGLSSGLGASITELCAAYNQTLQFALNGLAGAGVPTIRVDSFSTLEAMVDFPALFGFTNVTQPSLIIGGDQTEFLFWDSVHPTTGGHRVLADAARNQLVNYFSPRNGNGAPPALANALNGLVNAVGQGKP